MGLNQPEAPRSTSPMPGSEAGSEASGRSLEGSSNRFRRLCRVLPQEALSSPRTAAGREARMEAGTEASGGRLEG